MPTPDQITTRLETNTKRRRAAETKLNDLREEAARLIVEGDQCGVNKSKLSQAAGMTRQTIYTTLLRAKAGAA